MNDQLIPLDRAARMAGVAENWLRKWAARRGADRLPLVTDGLGHEAIPLGALAACMIKYRAKGGKRPPDVSGLAQKLQGDKRAGRAIDQDGRNAAYIMGDIRAANAAINNERAADRRTGLVEKLAMAVADIKLTVKKRVA
jgi:hypothetical protein